MSEQKIATKIEKALNEQDVAAVKKLRRELGEHLASGADKCKNCGHDVVGMLKTPGYFDQAKGVDVPPVYEVGCVICPPYLVEREDGKDVKLDGKAAKVKRRSYSARATTPEGAVANWNAEKFVEDFQLTRNVPDAHRVQEVS